MISVIMLTHNRKERMLQMIDDVLQQDFDDYELLVIDNGCTDGSGEVLDELEKENAKIRVIHQERDCSIGKARNMGFMHAAGDRIAYVDDDDRVSRDFLSFLDSLQKECDADIAMCGADEKLNGRTGPQCMYEEKYILSGKEAVMELLKREKIRAGTPTKLFRKTILEKFPFDEQARSEDIHTMYKYFAEAERVILHGLPKYHFIRHGMNNSMFTSDISRLTPEMLKEYLEAYRERADYLSGKYPEEKAFFEYTVWSFMISMCGKMAENGPESCNAILENMKNALKKERGEILESRYFTLEERIKLGRILDGCRNSG